MAFVVRSRLAIALVCLASASVAPAASAQISTTYTYDVQGQVTTVTRSGGAATYTYDAAGNRTAVGMVYPPPGAGPGSLSVAFGGSASLALPVSGQFTGAAIDAAPAKGSVSVSGTTATYTAGVNSYGADSFTYHAVGSGGNSAIQTISVSIATPPAPAVSNTTLSAAYGVSGSTWITPSGIYTTVTILTQPAHGQAGNNGNQNIADYIPSAGYFGPDSFTYTATGPGGTSAPATVSVTVSAPPPNTPPTAVNDGTVQIVAGDTAYVNVVANDTDPDGDTLTVIGLSKTTSTKADYSFSGGTITVMAKSSKGGDSLTYTISDGKGGTATATLSINVTF